MGTRAMVCDSGLNNTNLCDGLCPGLRELRHDGSRSHVVNGYVTIILVDPIILHGGITRMARNFSCF